MGAATGQPAGGGKILTVENLRPELPAQNLTSHVLARLRQSTVEPPTEPPARSAVLIFSDNLDGRRRAIQ
jgi:hypothetical protein